MPKKVHKTRKEKSLKMKRDVGMACQKVTQTREDIKVKVNIQSPMPASCYITVHFSVRKMQGWGYV